MQRLISFLAIIMVLTACQPSVDGKPTTSTATPTATVEVLPSATSTSTPEPTETATEAPTATPEIQYSMPSSPEDAVNHILDYDKDIASGKLQEWLKNNPDLLTLQQSEPTFH